MLNCDFWDRSFEHKLKNQLDRYKLSYRIWLSTYRNEPARPLELTTFSDVLCFTSLLICDLTNHTVAPGFLLGLWLPYASRPISAGMKNHDAWGDVNSTEFDAGLTKSDALVVRQHWYTLFLENSQHVSFFLNHQEESVEISAERCAELMVSLFAIF